jgi:hypothetical protein
VRTRQRPYAASPEKHKPISFLGRWVSEAHAKKSVRRLANQEDSTKVPEALSSLASFTLSKLKLHGCKRRNAYQLRLMTPIATLSLGED